ncbi:Anthranilate synthase component 1, partial [Haemophilus influenzae]
TSFKRNSSKINRTWKSKCGQF